METAKRIKLIWDFRGPAANETAAHYEKHLREFIALEGKGTELSGHKRLSDAHSMTYIVIDEEQLTELKVLLRPHRGELYETE